MLSKNRVKQYVAGGYYHVYNRGVEKRLVFMDDRDYRVFLSLLKLYLLPPEVTSRPHLDVSSEVDLLAYCLMPNHFHLLVRQHTERGMAKFMRCLTISYVRYFNLRYRRVGGLFQDVYKAAPILDNEQLWRVEAYIHANPAKIIGDVAGYPYSSLIWSGQRPRWLSALDADAGHYNHGLLNIVAVEVG